MALTYNDPVGGNDSGIGTQIRTDHFIKRALIEARKEQNFMPLSGTVNLPKNMGKKIKKYHYLPLLDDANINDQGIDAQGNLVTPGYKATIKLAASGINAANNGMNVIYIIGESTTSAADALTNAKSQAKLESAVQSAGYTITTWNVNWADTMDDYRSAGWQVTDDVHSDLGTYVVAPFESGNLYGSSKDIGTITNKLPVLSENGGRVNRVGFKRVEVEGSIEKFGFFDEWTQESLDFDSDADLEMHIHREMLNGATELTEDALQVDLLNSAGIVKYAGDATQNSDVDAADEVSYGDLLRLSIDLDNNRTPKHTKIATGTRLVDTRTLPAARILYCGSEMIPLLEEMDDLQGAPAFIRTHQYAAGSTVLNNEIGSVGQFRIIVVPEMLKWEGKGASSTSTASHYETAGQYDVFPMLVVGEGSFTSIGFQTDGKVVKFKIMSKKPGEAVADRTDPYGETGFMSIKWYYGFLLERPERIGLVKTVAKL